MRCNNCGWENPDNLSKCEKCGNALPDKKPQPNNFAGGTARENMDASPRGTAMESDSRSPLFGKTVCEANVFEEAVSPAPQPSPQKGNAERCPQCNYPLRPGVSVCPKCHYVLASPGATEREVTAGNEVKGNHRFGGTIMPGMNVAPDIWFSLTPLAIQGERETPAKVEFEGAHHELNRDRVDPKNHTITGKVQAIVDYRKDSKRWYIQDQSALHTTFLWCCGEVPLVDGDVLLMGDRRFVFGAPAAGQADPEPEAVLTGTIAVGRRPVNVPHCTLTPVADDGEQDAPKAQSFRGDAHRLNRANLDPENYTITSKVQAELTCENGQWFVKDCSQLQTTYILCQDPMDLKDGDRILMGNRIFTFNC